MTGLGLDGHKLHYHPDRVAAFLAGNIVWPIYAEISPTSRCNHRCRFCNFNYLGHDGQNLPDGRMPVLMDELRQGGVKAVVFAGAGEPSLHPDTFAAVRRAVERGLDVAMSTNGTLLDAGQLQAMAELLTWTRFSINGGTPESYAAVHGSPPEDFRRAVRNLILLAELKAKTGSAITIGTQCVLMPENRGDMAGLMRLLRESGADYFSIKHFYPHSDNAYRPDMSFLTGAYVEELRGLAARESRDGFVCRVRDPENLSRERPYTECFGLPFIVYVRENGNLHTCFSRQDDEAASVGSLLEQSFPVLWGSEGRERVLRHFAESHDKNECQANCRHHQINLWLMKLKNPPPHVNFV
jgi:MoaA/NifB/PqqE/SkfB family radical SAM enzyme